MEHGILVWARYDGVYQNIEEGYGFMAVESVTLVLIMPDQTIASDTQFILWWTVDRFIPERTNR